MMSRTTLVAALVLAQFAVIGAGVLAVRGGVSPASVATTGPHLEESGPTQTFAASPDAGLAIDIGNADLTIRTGAERTFSVSVAKSSHYGPMRETAPIVARASADGLHVDVTHQHDWAAGDDRMVTIEAPPATRVTVSSAGDIVATGLRAASSFASDHGDVTIVDYAAPALHVDATGGTISLRDVAAPDLDVTGGDSRVEIAGLTSRGGRIASDGRLEVEFAPGSDSSVTATTESGKIAATGFDVPEPVPSAGDDGDAASRFVRVGDGTGHLDVHTSDGDIGLRRRF